MKNLGYRAIVSIALLLMSLCLWAFSDVMLKSPQLTSSLESIQIIATFVILPLSIEILLIIRLISPISWQRLGLAFIACLLFTQAWGFHSLAIISGAFTLLAFLACYLSAIKDIHYWLNVITTKN